MTVEMDMLKIGQKHLDLQLVIKPDRNLLAMMMAQLSVESFKFTKREESANYSANRLYEVFPSHFKNLNEAAIVAKQGPKAILNRVYANRMGNGDETSGDGWKYRGRGLIQITGKNNYIKLTEIVKIDLVSAPDQLLALDTLGAISLGWILLLPRFRASAEEGNVLACTKMINGGTNGLKYRQEGFAYYFKLIEEQLNVGFFD